MQQNTPEWLEMRKGKIGASDINIIMGVSPYMSPLDLYLNKKGLPPRKKESDNKFILEKGHYLEDKIRAEIELEKGCDFPPVIMVHSQIEYLMASMDGFNSQWNIGLECKYVGQESYNDVVDWEPESNMAFPLPQYYPQIQQQYLCSAADKIVLVAITELVEMAEIDGKMVPHKPEGKLIYILDGDGKKLYKKVSKVVPLNMDYINNELIPAAVNFQKNHIEPNVEPDAGEADVIEIKNVEVGKKITEYKKNKEKISVLKDKLKPLETTEKKLKKEIFAMELVNAPKMICKGITITEGEKKGSIDYASAYESLLEKFMGIAKQLESMTGLNTTILPDLDNFRKSNTVTYTITVPKSKKEKEPKKTTIEKTTVGDISQTRETVETASEKTTTITTSVGDKTASTITVETPAQVTTPTESIKDKKAEWDSMTPEQQTIQGKSNAFLTEKGKSPRGWAGKTRAERIDYLEKLAKRKDSSDQLKKSASELANELKALP